MNFEHASSFQHMSWLCALKSTNHSIICVHLRQVIEIGPLSLKYLHKLKSSYSVDKCPLMLEHSHKFNSSYTSLHTYVRYD